MSWPLVTLDSISEIIKGVTFSKSDGSTLREVGTLPIIRAGSIQQELLVNEGQIWIEKDKIKASQLIKKDDIIMCMSSGSPNLVGKCAKAKDDWQGSFGAFCAGIRPNNRKCYPTYLFYFLSSTAFRNWSANSSGANIKNIRTSELAKFQIPLPPLETQKQIAAVLEKADQLRKDCQQMEQELNSLAQSVFIDMFGEHLLSQNKYVLGDVADVVSGVTKGQKFNGKKTVEVPYMRVANVQAGYLNLSEIKYIEAKDTDVKKYLLVKGDVLLTEGGDHDKLGRGAIWNEEVAGCIHQNHVFRVRLDREMYTPEWLNGYLKTPFAKNYFLKCAKKTTNLASINITQLKKLPMPTVTIEGQLKFEKIINSLNDKIEMNSSQLSDFELNFNSLMQKAFKGELNLKLLTSVA